MKSWSLKVSLESLKIAKLQFYSKTTSIKKILLKTLHVLQKARCTSLLYCMLTSLSAVGAFSLTSGGPPGHAPCLAGRREAHAEDAPNTGAVMNIVAYFFFFRKSDVSFSALIVVVLARGRGRRRGGRRSLLCHSRHLGRPRRPLCRLSVSTPSRGPPEILPRLPPRPLATKARLP